MNRLCGLDGYVGQEELVTQIRTAIAASRKRGKIVPHIFLAGPPGVGKTSLAARIAWDAEAPFGHLTFPVEVRVLQSHLIANVGFLLLDEIHQADRKTHDLLLPFLVTGEIRMKYTKRKNERVTIIAATTDPQKLPDALLSRFPLRPAFQEYSEEDLCTIIRHNAEEIPVELAEELSHACLGNPRQASALAEAYKDMHALNPEASATDVLGYLQITPNGLRAEHVQYLTMLRRQNGEASLDTISRMLFMPSEALKTVERDLLRLNMIGITTRGRQIKSTEWMDDVEALNKIVSGNENINPYTGERYAT